MWKAVFPLTWKARMCMKISPSEFVAASENIPVLDVRSPGEYEKGHFPGATPFPLFSNNERAEIGTMYKQVGQQEALQKGLELVGPKIKDMVVQAQAAAKNGKLLIHCWRGGMRSESVANLLNLTGLEVQTLEGGYKAFRNWVLEKLSEKHCLRVIGGMTGANKTGILRSLKEAGQATIDLEALAEHKGSSFGALGVESKVTQAQFENGLALQLHAFADRTIWIEDESRKIGTITLPGKLWEQMLSAPFYFIDVPRAKRIDHLVQGYGDYSQELLVSAILRIKNRLGGLRTSHALQFLAERDADSLVDLLLDYYDKAYQKITEKRNSKERTKILAENRSPEELARELVLRIEMQG